MMIRYYIDSQAAWPSKFKGDCPYLDEVILIVEDDDVEYELPVRWNHKSILEITFTQQKLNIITYISDFLSKMICARHNLTKHQVFDILSECNFSDRTECFDV